MADAIQVIAKNLNGALCRPQLPHNHLQKCGFARAGFSGNKNKFTFMNLQIGIDNTRCVFGILFAHMTKGNHHIVCGPVRISSHELLILLIHILHILHDHQRNLEGNGVFKDAQIQSRALQQLIQPVHQRIPMNEQLS